MANILIVEDEKNMQDIIAKFMKKGGGAPFGRIFGLHDDQADEQPCN